MQDTFNEKMDNAKDQFFLDLENNFDSVVATIHLKNSDYATDKDPFRNFREAADFAGVSIERAFLVRIGDKFGRYKNLLEKAERGESHAVQDETITDTLRDIMGYVNILAIYEDWKRKFIAGYLYSGAREDYETANEDEPEDYEVEVQPEEPVIEDPPAPVPPPDIKPESSSVKFLRDLINKGRKE